MKKLMPLLLAAMLPLGALGDDTPQPAAQTADPSASAQQTPDVAIDAPTNQVSIASKGLEIRNVLYDLFTQAKKNFVLEPNVHQALFLSLSGVEFDEALQIVCQVSDLQFEVQNGIYFIGKKKIGGVAAAVALRPNVAVVREAPPKPLGMVSDQDLKRKLTVRYTKTDIRDVFKEISKQTKVKIEVSPSVPAYKLDVYLIDTSLRFALDNVTKAAGLAYRKTDQLSIVIEAPDAAISANAIANSGAF